MAKRPEVLHDRRIVTYDDAHWSNLRRLRTEALDVMKRIEQVAIRPMVYGSVARGDVSQSSDIDIVILQPSSSYKIELAFSDSLLREVVQATPSSVLKGQIHLSDETVVSFPLFKLLSREEEFYRWGGLISSEDIESDVRVPGVDKRLLLIEPTPTGHIESGVIDNEALTAKRLNVNIDIAHERVRVLTRRDSVGRTGVYLNYRLKDSETFEEVTKRLKDNDPALRRTIERREGRRR